MLRSQRVLRVVFAMALIVAAGVGLAALFTDAEAKGPCRFASASVNNAAEAKGPCRCPMVYAPVECDKGKVYPNQCVADCKHAKNCVPIGAL